MRSRTETPTPGQLETPWDIRLNQSELYQPAERCQKGVIQSEPGDPGARCRTPRRLALPAADLAACSPGRRAHLHSPLRPVRRSPFWIAGALVAAGEALRLWGVHHIGAISRTRSDRLGPLDRRRPVRARPQSTLPRQHRPVDRLCRERAAALARADHRRAARLSSTTRSSAGKKSCSSHVSAMPIATTPRGCRAGCRRFASARIDTGRDPPRSRGARRCSASAGRSSRSRRDRGAAAKTQNVERTT